MIPSIKPSPRLLLFLGLVLTATAVPSFADTFDFSYVFGDGTDITGSFTGTKAGQFVNNVSNVSVFFDGTAMPGTIYTSTIDSGFDYLNGPVISFDASQNDFVFANSDLAGGDFSYDSFFLISNTAGEASAQSFPLGFSGSNDFPAVDSSWSLTQLLPAAVPDGGGVAGLFGLAMLGLIGFRRFAQI
jgi:hypothetical protein